MFFLAAITAVGGAIGCGAALLALKMSESDARGGKMLLIGLPLMSGCVLGFRAGFVWVVRHARRRGLMRGVP